MKPTRIFVLALAAAVLPELVHAQQPASAPGGTISTQTHPFQLSAGERRHSLVLPVDQPGRIRVQAIWTGPAQRLALILNAPGQVNTLARRDGSSPLTLEFTVTEAHLRQRGEWRVSIVVLEDPAGASGWILAEHPSRPQLVDVRPNPPLQPALNQPAAQPSTSPASPSLTITPEGTIERQFPDGSLKRYQIEQCGWETISPDGKVSRVMCVEVLRTQLADLPSGLLGDQHLSSWLDELSPHLLEAVDAIVGDEAAVQNYLTFEGQRPLAEQVDLRLRLLNRLLIARGGDEQ